MIPISHSDLRPSLHLKTGRIITAVLLLFWMAFEARFYVISQARSLELLGMLFVPGGGLRQLVSGLFVFQNTFSMLMNSLFVWIFLPLLFLRRRNFLLVPFSLLAVWIAVWSFFKMHPYLSIPVPTVEAWVAFFLGAAMRLDVWGNVDTLVFGPGILRIYKVPSYVLLFFWFFYLMIANIFMPEPFSNLPMIYWLPFVAFIQGFSIQTILLLVFPKRKSKINSHEQRTKS